MVTTLEPRRVECVVRGSDQLGETPLWCERERRLWWLDIERPALQWFDPASGRHERTPVDGCTFLGSQALCEDGTRLLALDLSLQRRDAISARLAPVADVARLEPGLDNRLNDGRVDARGRFWVGTMDNQLHRPQGALYRVDLDGSVHRVLDGVIVSNGIAFSPDQRTMVFADTRRHLRWRFDLDIEAGTLSNRRVFGDHTATKDRPDGACFDADGCLWTAFFAGGRVERQRPDGEVDLVVPLPVSHATCVCFGGADLGTLFITTAAKFLSPAQRAAEPLAGSLFAVHGVGTGLREHRFGARPAAPDPHPTPNERRP